MTFSAVHVERSGTFELPAPPALVLPLFSPEGERAGAPGWEPEYLHPKGGGLKPGLVFRTVAGGEQTLWLLLRFDARDNVAEYVRIVPESRLGTVTVRCTPGTPGATAVTVTYRLTALSAAGNQALELFTEQAFARLLAEWRSVTERALAGARV